ncbi:hypothetical protein HGRIS_001366 [Hohenbuehelia grisea]|uniref:Uncharacterized protein n=1 Tax=Hohenbuehelia grisea TaxID=104357 RepID=A0ABR3JPA8_9AGAR
MIVDKTSLSDYDAAIFDDNEGAWTSSEHLPLPSEDADSEGSWDVQPYIDDPDVENDDEEYAPSVDGEVSDEGMAEGEVADDAGGFNDEVLLAHADSPSRGKKEQAPERYAWRLLKGAGKRMRGDDIGGLRPDWKKQVKRKDAHVPVPVSQRKQAASSQVSLIDDDPEPSEFQGDESETVLQAARASKTNLNTRKSVSDSNTSASGGTQSAPGTMFVVFVISYIRVTHSLSFSLARLPQRNERPAEYV